MAILLNMQCQLRSRACPLNNAGNWPESRHRASPGAPLPLPRTKPQVPQAHGACQCPISVRLTGDEMRLSCPRKVANVTDFYWQVRGRLAAHILARVSSPAYAQAGRVGNTRRSAACPCSSHTLLQRGMLTP